MPKPLIRSATVAEISAYFLAASRVFLTISHGIADARNSVMKKPYDIQDRAFLFACDIVDFCRPLVTVHPIVRELGRQLLKAGTSVGANLEEADGGESKPDFRHK